MQTTLVLGCGGCTQLARTQVPDSTITDPAMIKETAKKIVKTRGRLKASRNRQKIFVDKQRDPLEFQVKDSVILNVFS